MKKGDNNFVNQYLESIAKDVANLTGVPLRTMKGASRKFQIVLARHLYFYAAKYNRKGYNFSLSEIGDVLNNDHATVIHGIKRIENELEIDVQEIKHKVKLLTFKGPSQYVLTYSPIDLLNLTKTGKKIESLDILSEYTI